MGVIPIERIAQTIYLVRGHRVLLDEELSRLYQVQVKALNQAVKRNLERFPHDFMFQLTAEEYADLRSQNVTARSWGGRRNLPFAFTEQGVGMLSSVLRSPRAAQVNIAIIRAFVQLRQLLASNTELERKLAALEKKYDRQFKVVFDAIRELMEPAKPKPTKGFAREE